MTVSRYPATIHVDQEMIDKIDKPIDPAVISSRQGAGNSTVAYLKGDILADQLNAIFGPLGWSKASRIHSVDDWEEEKLVQRNNQATSVNMKMVQVISDVTLTIKKVTADGADTVFVEQGVGYGEVESGRSRKEAFGMAVKGASTDGLKRCSSLLGKAFGMMMASNGQQEDIQYAHNGKNADLKKARDMRSGGSAANNAGRGGDGGDGRQQARQTQSNRASDDRDRDGEQPRHGGGADGADRNRGAAADNAKDAGKGVDDSSKAEGNNPAAKPAAAAGQATKARREADTNYPLESVPVTKDDQTDFAATLYARTKGMRQKSDRDGLVRQHINTIRNLDGGIRKHLCNKLTEEGVDVDRL